MAGPLDVQGITLQQGGEKNQIKVHVPPARPSLAQDAVRREAQSAAEAARAVRVLVEGKIETFPPGTPPEAIAEALAARFFIDFTWTRESGLQSYPPVTPEPEAEDESKGDDKRKGPKARKGDA